jgi:membrane protein implicated in regulation of membrane protease activity
MDALFNSLLGVSPWWWIAFGLLLGALEMATGSFFLIGPGVAAAIVGVILFVNPEMAGEFQVTIFAIVSIILTWAARLYTAKIRSAPSDRPGLNRRAGQIVGRRGTVLDPFHHGEGAVDIGGVRWLAKLQEGETLKKGEPIEVVAAEGTTLTVKPI